MKHLDDITGAIVDASLAIHRDLGPGLLESIYEAVLARALERRGLTVERQKVIRFTYDGMVFEEGFRADLLVDVRLTPRGGSDRLDGVKALSDGRSVVAARVRASGSFTAPAASSCTAGS